MPTPRSRRSIWGSTRDAEPGRLAQNVAAVYRALDPELPLQPLTEIFGEIADLEGFTADAGLYSAATGGGN